MTSCAAADDVDMTDRLEFIGRSTADGLDWIRGSTDLLEWIGASSFFSRSSTDTQYSNRKVIG